MKSRKCKSEGRDNVKGCKFLINPQFQCQFFHAVVLRKSRKSDRLVTESEGIKPRLCESFCTIFWSSTSTRFVVTACIGGIAVCKGNSIFVIEDLLTFFTIHPLLCFHAVPSFFRIYMLCNKTLEHVTDHCAIFFVIGPFACFAHQNRGFWWAKKVH